jgi:hypothetical protein
MRNAIALFTVLLLSLPTTVLATDGPATAADDGRYPVAVGPAEALRQKAEMRDTLVALRETLAGLAAKDFVAVEKSLRVLGHEGSAAGRAGATTPVFRQLEEGFEASVDKAVAASRTLNSEAVLKELSAALGFCQSCHQALRQVVVPKPEPGETAPTAP